LHLKNTAFQAYLTSEGKLEFQGQIYDIHTLAAHLKNTKAKRLNGFMYWEAKRGESKILLNEIREEYRKSLPLA
ncbi:site-specific DNA-methyltransferase, partial [Helicobacter sp. MIT 14-3879]